VLDFIRTERVLDNALADKVVVAIAPADHESRAESYTVIFPPDFSEPFLLD
jgi:hypothetical protein